VIARFGRRLLEGLVALFALLGFAFVPLGEHTGLEHLKAIASTPRRSAQPASWFRRAPSCGNGLPGPW
jgi:hypothetical protein